ncbi:DUF354 domain-containing protein [Natronorarus salvus]|uniref:DUF354 domain-containing protein n=1 Tax=Natronorarus salvus TaxID=3117733 RepID=UPI002F25FD7F
MTTTTRTTARYAVWIDLASPSHPFFFDALVDGLSGVDVRTTVRRKTETAALSADLGFDHRVIGRDFDDPRLRKVGIPLRAAELAVRMPDCGVSLSSRNAMCILASRARGVPSIHFTDNDITAYVPDLTAEKLYNRIEATATHNVVPRAFRVGELYRRGAGVDRVHTYDGYKEDVYVATFEPDPAFLDRLPFSSYLVVRPEALTAAYIDPEVESIVPRLLSDAVDRGYNVVYLPRKRGDEGFCDGFPADRVYVPPTPLNGLDLAWHANCVLTGSGTMAREAACMGKPAVSFFPAQLLSVDRELVGEGRVFHSREPRAILDHIDALDAADRRPDLRRSRRVRAEVAALTERLVAEVAS